MASDTTFRLMLSDAVKNNPDCDILVKTHPDALVGNGIRKGYYQGLKRGDRIIPITFPINPYSLLSYVDEVYVCSS